MPLRLLGALHRQVLHGALPDLAAMFPSVGGDASRYRFEVVLEAMAAVRELLVEGLDHQVQTNEVGRSVVHLSLGQWLGNAGVTEFDFFELGASAGLNLSFPYFSAQIGVHTMGSATSPVNFDESWFDVPPPVEGSGARARLVRGCDPFPIDATTRAGAMTLKSFVWPDQVERFSRLSAAIDIAERHRPRVEQASADEWLVEVLRDRPHRSAIVFHSIVWQYLAPAVKQSVRDALNGSGGTATRENPLIWARMEPAGPVADVQVDVWCGEATPRHARVATIGYHGAGLKWDRDAASALLAGIR